MRVQLSEKSKSEFIELIAKDSITCWFEGDEFVMPSGQGKTAKGIVLGKLVVWQSRQTEVDGLNQHIKRLESKLDEIGSDRQGLVGELDKAQSQTLSALKTSEQNAELAKEVFRERDELQYKAKIRESDHQALLVKYQATKKCWEDMGKEKDGLKEHLDSIIHQAKEFIQSCKNDADIFEDENAAGKAYGAEAVVELLEQALKGGGE